MSERNGKARRGTARGLVGRVLAAIAAVAVTLPAAAAAAPKAGCWGTCGGDRGPVDGYFVVGTGADKGKLVGFLIEEKCLGVTSIPQPVGPPFKAGYELGPLPTMKISASGHFSFDGKTNRTSAHGRRKAGVRLNGSFVNSTKVEISLKVDYGSCGPMHITMHAG
jgi:hypothetical protein